MAIGDINRYAGAQQATAAVYTNPAQNMRTQRQGQQAGQPVGTAGLQTAGQQMAAQQTAAPQMPNPVRAQNPGTQNTLQQANRIPAQNAQPGANRAPAETNQGQIPIAQLQQGPTTSTRNIVRRMEENTLYNTQGGGNTPGVQQTQRQAGRGVAQAGGVTQRPVNRTVNNLVPVPQQIGGNNQPNPGNLAGTRFDIFA